MSTKLVLQKGEACL